MFGIHAEVEIMTRPKPVPSAKNLAVHQLMSLSPRQAKRLASGKNEGQPSDYRDFSTEEDRARTEARHKLEDLKMARELGIDL